MKHTTLYCSLAIVGSLLSACNDNQHDTHSDGFVSEVSQITSELPENGEPLAVDHLVIDTPREGGP